MNKNIDFPGTESCEFNEEDNLFEKLKDKLVYVNGLLSLKQRGQSYSVEQKLIIEQLISKLSAVMQDFNQSERSFSDVESALSSIKAIEKETKSISFN